MPKLVIVGNGPVGDKDHSELVEAADCVLRFNHCQTYLSGQVGIKTDILALRRGHLGKKLHFPSKVLHQAREFRLYDCEEHPPAKNFNYAKRQPLMAGKLRPMDTTWVKNARMVLRDGVCDHANWKSPTIGFIVLLHVLDEDPFTDYDTTLVGFTWKKLWRKHPQLGEKQICERLARTGRIKLVQ
jgi:hypothetical protein